MNQRAHKSRSNDEHFHADNALDVRNNDTDHNHDSKWWYCQIDASTHTAAAAVYDDDDVDDDDDDVVDAEDDNENRKHEIDSVQGAGNKEVKMRTQLRRLIMDFTMPSHNDAAVSAVSDRVDEVYISSFELVSQDTMNLMYAKTLSMWSASG